VNEGVQILLERMKTHPEEFTPEYDGGVTKWGNAIGQYRTYLTAEDNKALDDAWKQAVGEEMQRRFTQAVMEELIDPKSEKSQWEQRDIVSAGQTHAQHMAIQQAYLAQQQAAIQQAQAAQQAPGSITNLVGGAGQGLLGTWFGGNK
jgi:hypothetical protein